jgi:hypothetical protein
MPWSGTNTSSASRQDQTDGSLLPSLSSHGRSDRHGSRATRSCSSRVWLMIQSSSRVPPWQSPMYFRHLHQIPKILRVKKPSLFRSSQHAVLQVLESLRNRPPCAVVQDPDTQGHAGHVGRWIGHLPVGIGTGRGDGVTGQLASREGQPGSTGEGWRNRAAAFPPAILTASSRGIPSRRWRRRSCELGQVESAWG